MCLRGSCGPWIEQAPSVRKPWLLGWPEATVGFSAELMGFHHPPPALETGGWKMSLQFLKENGRRWDS